MEKPEVEPIVIDPGELRIWVIGHSTTLINFYGTTILTDPVLVNFLPFPKRLVAHSYTAEQLPPLDYIMISHVHLDHCDKRTLRRLAPKTKNIIVPRGCSDIVEGMPFQKIIELDWKKNLAGELSVTAYRPNHWGNRTPWEKRDRGYNCYVMEKSGRTVFFGGDTGYGKFFRYIGQRHDIDVALLPIGAYTPYTPHHMGPAEAHQAFVDLKAGHCIPIHWGSFRLALEPITEPPELFMHYAYERGIMDRTHVLENGESFSLMPAREPCLVAS